MRLFHFGWRFFRRIVLPGLVASNIDRDSPSGSLNSYWLDVMFGILASNFLGPFNPIKLVSKSTEAIVNLVSAVIFPFVAFSPLLYRA